MHRYFDPAVAFLGIYPRVYSYVQNIRGMTYVSGCSLKQCQGTVPPSPVLRGKAAVLSFANRE